MSSDSNIRLNILAIRQQLADARESLFTQHLDQASGRVICRQFTEVVDSILIKLFVDALSQFDDSDQAQLRSKICLVLHGGSGRREMAPYSDVDLMILNEGVDEDVIAKIASKFTQNVFDIGIQLGLSVRTPRQATQLMIRDATIYTSLCEARKLTGADEVYAKFEQRFAQSVKRRTYYLIERAEAARKEERIKYGETVFLLRPNVKRSRGALRDIHLVRWIAYTRYGTADFDELKEQDILSEADHAILYSAREFLLRVRNEMHFASGKSQDLLGKAEQVRIAEQFGYEGTDAVLAVERFMSEYFQHTSDVRYTSAHFLAMARARSTLGSIVAPMFSVSIEGDFRVGPFHVGATKQGLEKVTQNLVDVLRLMELANAFNRRIEHPTWQAIRESMMNNSETIELTPEAARRFIGLMSESARLADLLRRLHEMRVLEQIIPAFRHATALLQFNEYHKYTVDEHSLRTVDFATRCVDDGSVLGDAYRSIRNKSVLHLALLLHDIGKGYPGDHSLVGMGIAEQTAERLGLDEHDKQTISFLVQHHLVMAHLAFRRNIDDAVEIARFAALVGSVDRLKMLFVLTCADLASVGPEVLNDWKQSLLNDLYTRASEQLAGNYSSTAGSPAMLKLLEYIHGQDLSSDQSLWLDSAARRLSDNLLTSCDAAETTNRLKRAAELSEGRGEVWAQFDEPSKTCEYSVAAYDRPQSGYFHKLTGVLTSQRVVIHSAEVAPLDEHRAMLRFVVTDLDHEEQPPESRIEDLRNRLLAILEDRSDQRPSFREVWSSGESNKLSKIKVANPQVRVDNESSEQFTLIDVFAHDRLGLLYDVTRTLFELGLEIRYAKIGTYLDQVVDVFYVTDANGKRVTEFAKIRSIVDAVESILINRQNSPQNA